MNKRICIGLTGRMGCGKGEAVNILEEMGFTYISLSDIVREEVAKSGKEMTRFEMQDTGNRLRKEGGAGILGAMVRSKIEASHIDKWIIDGVRNPLEIVELKKLPTFHLVAIAADITILLERLKARKRSTDIADDDELRRRLEREWGTGEPPDGQHVGQCMAAADVTIQNEKSLSDLRLHLLNLLADLNISQGSNL